MLPNFPHLLHLVVLLTALCAIMGVVVAVINSFIPMPQAEQLIGTFTETFKLGMAAIVGLIGGRAGSGDA